MSIEDKVVMGWWSLGQPEVASRWPGLDDARKAVKVYEWACSSEARWSRFEQVICHRGELYAQSGISTRNGNHVTCALLDLWDAFKARNASFGLPVNKVAHNQS